MKKKITILSVVGIFLVLLTWGVFVNLTHDANQMELFSDSYWVLPLLCGIIGLNAAKRWGGFKSIFGKAVSFLSIGLLAQAFGQIVNSYYARVQQIEVPYPSIGDIGFFGAVVAYIAGTYFLTKTVGTKAELGRPINKFAIILIPIVAVSASYYIFLKDYDYSFSTPITTALDFGYPLGDAIYISIAVVAFLVSRTMLGGVMRKGILFILGALVIQYIADFTFLYRFSREIYEAGGISDLIYLIGYFVMGVALIGLIKAYDSILNTAKQKIAEMSENE